MTRIPYPLFSLPDVLLRRLVIGTILPRSYHESGHQRPNNVELSNISDWSRQYIRDEELQAAQLPDKIPT